MLKKKIISFLLLSMFIITPALAADVQLKDYIDPIGMIDKSNSTTGISETFAMAVGKILDQIFGILGILALCIMVYSGIVYITSLGKNDKASKALKYMEWAAIGLVVIFFSYAIVSFVLNEIVKVGGQVA